MGTNYYIRVNECSCCGRHDELHVGKSGTSVQAIIQPDWAEGKATPVGDIRSWSDWKRLMAEVAHSAWNEYGEQLTDEQLVGIFESSPPAARRRQYDWMVANRESLERDWLDDDGFSVTSVDFS